MPDPLLYCKAIGAATIVSTLIVLTILAVGRSVTATWVNAACVLAIALGLAVGYCILSLQLRWPPVSALDRFLMIVIPATLVIELLAGIQSTPRWLAWLLRLSLLVTIPRVLLHGSIYLSDSGPWTPWQTGAALALTAVLLAVLWSLLSWLSHRSPGVSIPLALGLTIACVGATVMMGGYIKGGAAAFPFAATLIGTAIGASLITKRLGTSAAVDTPVIIGVGVVGLFGLLFVGHFFGRISVGGALTMMLSPLLCWVTEMPLLRDRMPWIVGSVRLAFVSIPLVLVLTLAKRDFDRDMSPLLGQEKTPTIKLQHQ